MHLTEKNTLFLDVRSNEEYETIAFSLVHHIFVVEEVKVRYVYNFFVGFSNYQAAPVTHDISTSKAGNGFA